MKIGLFYGSDTGNTEALAETMRDEIGEHIVNIQGLLHNQKKTNRAFQKIYFPKKSRKRADLSPFKHHLTVFFMLCLNFRRSYPAYRQD